MSKIHTPEDGRGFRRVYVDGQEISNVVYVDEELGVVDYVPYPIKMENDKIKKCRLHGTVKVEFIL